MQSNAYVLPASSFVRIEGFLYGQCRSSALSEQDQYEYNRLALDITKVRVLMETMIRAIVSQPGCVAVRTSKTSTGRVLFSVHVDPDDLGHVIGRQRRTARSLRVVLSAIGSRQNTSYSLDIAADGKAKLIDE